MYIYFTRFADVYEEGVANRQNQSFPMSTTMGTISTANACNAYKYAWKAYHPLAVPMVEI